jgi:hypothetical protein
MTHFSELILSKPVPAFPRIRLSPREEKQASEKKTRIVYQQFHRQVTERPITKMYVCNRIMFFSENQLTKPTRSR